MFEHFTTKIIRLRSIVILRNDGKLIFIVVRSKLFDQSKYTFIQIKHSQIIHNTHEFIKKTLTFLRMRCDSTNKKS